MGKISKGNSSHHTHPGRVWGILHVIKYHHWRHVKRRLTHKRLVCGGHHARTSDDSGVDNVPEEPYEPNTTLYNVENLVQSTPPTKHSLKSRIKALLNDEIYKKKGQHKRSSTCPGKSQLTRADSLHHLEVDPLSELLLTVESPEPVLETFQNHLAAGTLDVLSPVFSDKPITNNDKCLDCGTLFSSDTLEHSKTHKHQKQLADTKNLSSSKQDAPEEKSIYAKILTTDVSPHLFRDFLDALDLMHSNKDFLLEYIQDPGSPLPFHIHNKQAFRSKQRRANSISFPVSGSSSASESGQLINKMVDEWFNEKGKRQLQSQSHKQNVSMSQSSEDCLQQSRSSGSLHKVDQFLNPGQEWFERDHNSSLVSSHVPNHVKTRHFKDLRKKIKHIIEESKNEKHRITMDAILDKIPHGNKISKNAKKFMPDQFKDPTVNGAGKDSATSGYGSRVYSYSFNKRHPSTMRTSSLKESANRYSQLYETCFNSEVKYPKPEGTKLKTGERSSILKTPKSFKRFLSLPNLKSYFHQSEEPSVVSSPHDSIRQFGDRTTSTNVTTDQQSFEHSEDSKCEVLSPSHGDNMIQESILNAGQNKLLVRSDSKSGSDVNNEEQEDKSKIIDDLGNLSDRDDAACNERDTGPATESTTMPGEANSVFSSDTSFLYDTFEFEKLNILEDSELQPGPADTLDSMAEQQEAKVDQPEVAESGKNLKKFGTLSKRFNYEIPCIKVDASHEAAFNYVRKVLELSGFTGHEFQGLWYSNDQPVDPSVYEELEGCLLLDPDCSGNCDEGGQCNHLLLFDIINEGLLEIFGRSYSYYPRPLSYLSHVHPLPAGDNVLHKVWALISWYLNSTSEAYPSLDYYVSRDLAKNDGWMNLQFDSECVGLELDDLIFDDLLEEIVST